MTASSQRPRTAGRPPGFDRPAVLGVAMDLLWNGGVEATPVGELISAMGLSRSSFYTAFGSKRGVMLAAIRLYSRQGLDLLSDISQRPEGSQEKLRDLVRTLAMIDEERGCFVVNCITELGRHDGEVRQIAASHNAEVERIIADTLPEGPDADRSARARGLVSAAYGATLLKSAGTDRAAIREMLDALVDRA